MTAGIGRPETDIGAIPEENRFALASADGSVVLFRATGRGIVAEVSRDGVHWEPDDTLKGNHERLWPLYSSELVEGTDLFCVNAEGRIVPTARQDDRLSAVGDVSPITDTAAWYESPPDPHDTVILQGRDDGVYRAVFCARRTIGRQSDRRGCIGLARSDDLRTWNVEPPIFAPNRYARLLSPHLLSDRHHTVLFYATPESGGLRALRYAIAPAPDGPFEATEPDLLSCDVRGFIHTVRLGERRLAFFGRSMPGELHIASVSRPGAIEFHPDGRPVIRFYDGLLSLLGKSMVETEAELASTGPLARLIKAHGTSFYLRARLRSEGASQAGLLFRTTLAGHDNITLWLDFEEGALAVRRGMQGRLLARCRRPLHRGGEYDVGVWVEGSYVDVYLDREWVLTARAEARRAGGFGLAVCGGKARFTHVTAQPVGGF